MSCLIIQENTCFQLNNFYVSIKSHIDRLADIDYYKVSIQEVAPTNFGIKFNSHKLGLLRVGDINGGLSHELQLRHVLKESKILSELLTFGVEEIELFSSTATEDDFDSFNHSNLEVDLIDQSFALEIIDNCKNIDEPTLPQLTDNLKELSSSESYFDGDWEEIEDYEYLEDEYAENTNVLPNSKLILLSDLPTEGQTLDTWLQKNLATN